MSILYSENGHYLTLPLISPQPMMVERQTIPHLNALESGSEILEEQLKLSHGLSRNLFFKMCILFKKGFVIVPDKATWMLLRYFGTNINWL